MIKYLLLSLTVFGVNTFGTVNIAYNQHVLSQFTINLSLTLLGAFFLILGVRAYYKPEKKPETNYKCGFIQEKEKK